MQKLTFLSISFNFIHETPRKCTYITRTNQEFYITANRRLKKGVFNNGTFPINAKKCRINILKIS